MWKHRLTISLHYLLFKIPQPERVGNIMHACFRRWIELMISAHTHTLVHSLKTINFRVILEDPPIGFKCHLVYCDSSVRLARNQQTRTEFNNRIFSHNISDGINSNGKVFLVARFSSFVFWKFYISRLCVIYSMLFLIKAHWYCLFDTIVQK